LLGTDYAHTLGWINSSRISGSGTMTRNFHEAFSQAEVKPPSERATGLVFAVVAAVVAAIWHETPWALWVFSAIAVALIALSLRAPDLLRPLNIVWFQIGILLHRVVSPLVMFIIFAVVFVPAGLLMRIWYDPLRSKRAVDTSTYWIERSASTPTTGSMKNQF
jgi:hypothetical protein